MHQAPSTGSLTDGTLALVCARCAPRRRQWRPRRQRRAAPTRREMAAPRAPFANNTGRHSLSAPHTCCGPACGRAHLVGAPPQRAPLSERHDGFRPLVQRHANGAGPARAALRRTLPACRAAPPSEQYSERMPPLYRTAARHGRAWNLAGPPAAAPLMGSGSACPPRSPGACNVLSPPNPLFVLPAWVAHCKPLPAPPACPALVPFSPAYAERLRTITTRDVAAL